MHCFLPPPPSWQSITSDNAAFFLNDVYLYLGKRKLPLATAMYTELKAITSCALHFTTQKNLQKGADITQSLSYNFHCYPIEALVRMVLRHMAYFASHNIPFDSRHALAI